MTHDQNKKTLRSFQCRDYLWDIFQQMSSELECSVDYLVNEAMRQYARSRNYGVRPQSAPPPSGGPGYFQPPQQQAPQQQPPAGGGRPSIPSLGGGGGGAPSGGFPPPPASGGYGGPPSAGGYAPPPQGRGGSFAPPPPPRPPAYGGPPQHSAPPQQQHAPQHSAPPQAHGGPPGGMPGGYPPQGSSGAPPPLPGRGMPPQQPSMGPAGGARPMMYVIFNGQKIPVTKDEFVIGRGSKTADLPIKDGNISRRHAAVVYQAGAYYMKDLGSTNGVEFGGRRIDSKRIDEGDVYQITDYELRFTFR